MVLTRKDPEAAQALHDQMDRNIHLRHERLTAMAKKPEKPAEGGDGGDGAAAPPTQ